MPGGRQLRPVPVRSDLHETIVENMFDGVYYVDRRRTITYWNPAAERITGYPAEEVVGRRCFDNILRHVNDCGDELCVSGCPLVRAMAQRRGVEEEVFLHHVDGHRVPVHVRCQPVREPDGTVVGAVEIFKQFNDAHGHAVGDAVLKVVSRSVAGALRESDLAARWGGEEFVVITAASDEAQIRTLAERIRVLVAASDTTSKGRQRGVTVSIGATLAAPTDTLETLINRADRAMYASKSGGRDRTTFAGVERARE